MERPRRCAYGGPNLLDLTPGFQRHNPTLSALELEEDQKQGQEQLLVAKISAAASPQVQIEPLDGHLQIFCDMVKAGLPSGRRNSRSS